MSICLSPKRPLFRLYLRCLWSDLDGSYVFSTWSQRWFLDEDTWLIFFEFMRKDWDKIVINALWYFFIGIIKVFHINLLPDIIAFLNNQLLHNLHFCPSITLWGKCDFFCQPLWKIIFFFVMFPHIDDYLKSNLFF